MKAIEKIEDIDNRDLTMYHGRGLQLSNEVNESKQKAKVRKKEWSLTTLEAAVLLRRGCYYCGKYIDMKMGIDRIDSKLGYLSNNAVTACFPCNSAKGIMTIEEFQLWVKNFSGISPKFFERPINVFNDSLRKTKGEKIREARAKQDMSHLHKAVVHIETGIEYPTLAAASQALGVHNSKICLVLKGQRRHTKGMTFRYANEEAPIYVGQSEEEKEKSRIRAAEFYKNKKI